jgi:hypothetical protein
MKDKIIITLALIVFFLLCFVIIKLHSYQENFKPLKTEREI